MINIIIFFVIQLIAVLAVLFIKPAPGRRRDD
jgi:hypothetical protein